MVGSVWTRDTAQAPPREALTRAQIIRAAIELLDEEGLAGLSMRKLGARLSVAATTLYWHVQTKDDLLEYAIDEVYGEIDVPGPELAGWRGGATLLAHSFRATVLRHPWLPAVANVRISIGPNAMALSSGGLRLFRAAGFQGTDVEDAVGAMVSYVMGKATSEVAWWAMVKESGKPPQEWSEDALAQALPAAEGFPEIQEMLRRRAARKPETALNSSFAFGLECLLDGFAARLSSRRLSA
jgi:AcrR family transcriptional regulator